MIKNAVGKRSGDDAVQWNLCHMDASALCRAVKERFCSCIQEPIFLSSVETEQTETGGILPQRGHG